MGREINRRTFLRATGVALAIGSFALNPSDLLFPKQTPPTFASVFGMHDTPNVGGSMNTELAVADLVNLGARSLVAIDPSEKLLSQTRQAGIAVIIRGYFAENRFDGEQTVRILGKLRSNLHPIVMQPFNEVNLMTNTGGVERSPSAHIKEDFIPAAEVIDSYGGLTLLTPSAQRAQSTIDNLVYDDVGYLEESLIELRKQKSASWIQERVALGFHSYIFGLGESPVGKILEADEVVRETLGIRLPFYITEGGLYQDESHIFDEPSLAWATIELLKTPIPRSVQVESMSLWILSNMVQRPSDTQLTKELREFELSAWRRSAEDTRLVYKAVAAMTA